MATMEDSKHVLNRLRAMGDDALANFYTIILPSKLVSLASFGTIKDPLTFRIHNVSIPERTVNTYDITKRGRKFSRPNGLNEQSREVTFNFHPDRNFETYRLLSAWMSLVQDNVSMYMGNDGTAVSEIRADIGVKSISNLTGGIGDNLIDDAYWLLKGAFITSLGGIEFDDESGDPLDVSVTLNCFNIIYPGSESGTIASLR